MLLTGISKKLKRAFTENLHLKIIALAIAVILWGIVYGERNTERAYLVPLEIIGKRQDLIITSNIPNFLDLRIQGPRSFIMGLNPKDMAVQLDLTNIEVGRNILPVTSDKMNVPRGVRITRINPSYVMLDIENLVKKTVSVKGEIRGKPADDFIVEAVEVIPQSVEITGAESELQDLEFLKTAGVDISGTKIDIKKDVPINIVGRKVALTKEKPVTVKVSIKEVTSRLELKGVKISVVGSELKTSLKPSKLKLLLEGPKSVINSIKREGTITATVDMTGASHGTYKKEVGLDLPTGIKVLYSDPREVTVKVAGK